MTVKTAILMYHRVGDDSVESQFTISVEKFGQQMRALKELGYQVVHLDAIAAAVEGAREVPEKSVAITFDDGFLDTYQNACPMLLNFGFPATFFVVSALMGKTNSWMESEGYPSAPLMSWADAKALTQAGFAIGSHTRTHRRLEGLEEKSLREEIVGSKQDIEDRLGGPVGFFAYPYGNYDAQVREVVQAAGFRAACSTRSGFNNRATDRLELRRIDVRGTDSKNTFLRSLTFGENSMTATRLFQYYAGRAASRLGIGSHADGH